MNLSIGPVLTLANTILRSLPISPCLAILVSLLNLRNVPLFVFLYFLVIFLFDLIIAQNNYSYISYYYKQIIILFKFLKKTMVAFFKFILFLFNYQFILIFLFIIVFIILFIFIFIINFIFLSLSLFLIISNSLFLIIFLFLFLSLPIIITLFNVFSLMSY